MKHLLLFLPALLFIIISCSDNESTEPFTYTDAELKAKIIGKWSNVYTSINFKADGSFTENIDIDYTVSDTIVNQSEVISGTYEIENGILSKNIIEWDIINNSFLGGGYMPPASKIIFVKNLLYSYPLEICTRTGDDTDSLWGEWYTFFWMHEYSDPQAFGKLQQTYNFNEDSMTVTTGSRYPFDSSAVFYYQTDALTYNPPEISWENNIPRIIEFHGSQMWMYYKLNQPPTPLKKVE